MCTSEELDLFCALSEQDCNEMRQAHDHKKKRHQRNFEVKKNQKLAEPTVQTKRRGIGALRLQRRIRDLARKDKFGERHDVVFVDHDLLDLENEIIMAEMERERERNFELIERDTVIILLDDDALGYFGGGFHVTNEQLDALALN